MDRFGFGQWFCCFCFLLLGGTQTACQLLKPSQSPTEQLVLDEKGRVVRIQSIPNSLSEVSTKRQQDAEKNDQSMHHQNESIANQEAVNKQQVFQNESFVDADQLLAEKKVLDAEGKFYVLPSQDGTLKSQYLPSEILSQTPKSQPDPDLVAVTTQYISAADVTKATDLTCVSTNSDAIYRIKTNQVSFSIPKRVGTEQLIYQVVSIPAGAEFLHVMSFSNGSKNPSFYWPLIVLLDEKGCVEGGVTGYFKQKQPETILQHASLTGTVKLKKSTRFVLLSPVEKDGSLDDTTKLEPYGSLKLMLLELPK